MASLLGAKKHEQDMTQGGIAANLIKFALPLLIGNLFQQMYNMVDTWVIGQSGDNGAYAAVGSVGPIINILIGFFSGLASGAGVVISQYFGAKDRENVKRAVHTSVAITIIMMLAFTLIGVTMTPTMLRLMLKTEETSNEIFAAAKTYLTIYFAGVSGLMVYNMGSGILRAVGDSQRPLYYLIVSAVTNTVLDLLFVFRFHMGAAGVAWATIIAQFLSSILVVITLLKSGSWVQVVPKEIRVDMPLLKKIVKVGIPAAVQMALTAFSNVFVQSYIGGTIGDQAVNLGAWTTYSKVDQFIFLPMQSLALAATTFVGQNLGKGSVERAKKGILSAYLMSTGCSIVLIIPTILFAPFLSALFNPNADVVAQSAMLLHYLTPFYLFCSVNQIFSASLRGAGQARAPMIFMLTSFIGVRQIYLYVVSNFVSNHLLPIGISYPVGWGCCAILTLTYYLRFDFNSVQIVDRSPKKEEEADA